MDMAKKIEGCARHISVHAAGVVIAPKPLTEYSPLQFDHKKRRTRRRQRSSPNTTCMPSRKRASSNSTFSASEPGHTGRCRRAREKNRRGSSRHRERALDDKKTFEMLARGETVGTFQLNGSGMTQYLVDLKPTKIEDISLMVALYRPGPMDNINEYILRKNGKKPVTYLHPAMKKFLEPTYGVLVYQDDLLMTAIEVAGYTWGEVDKFRKAVGKKIPEEMAKQHELFVAGCQKHGRLDQRSKAEDIWELFEPFQGYGFNKAHAASYGKVAYQTRT